MNTSGKGADILAARLSEAAQDPVPGESSYTEEIIELENRPFTICIWKEPRQDGSVLIVGQLARKTVIPGLSVIISDGIVRQADGIVRKVSEDEFWDYVT